jgi:MFS family permease
MKHSLAAILIGEEGAILFAIAGVGIAPIYPTVMAVLAKRYANGIGTAITFTVTLMGIACVIGNLLIGLIIEFVHKKQGVEGNQILGLQAGNAFIAILALLCSASCIIMYVILRKRNEVI